MKTIVWIASLALVAGCSANSGTGDGPGGGEDTPADQNNGTSTNTGTGGDVHLPPLGLLPPPDRTIGTIPPGVIGNGGTDPGPSDGEGESNTGGTQGGETDAGTDMDSGTDTGDWTPPSKPPKGPTCVEGNPTCADVFGPGYGDLKIEQLKDGTYTSADGAFSVTVEFDRCGCKLSYTCASSTLVGVLVKGGPHANEYETCASEGTDLMTPSCEDISHVDFCYALTAPG